MAPSASTRLLLLTLGAAAATACTEAEGGAIELSWKLRALAGALPDDAACAMADVSAIRLWWQVDDQRASTSWPCPDNRAATAFVVPPGQASIWVQPECLTGLAGEATYEAPPPIVRTIRAGDVTSLDAVVIAVQIADCDNQPCICR